MRYKVGKYIVFVKEFEDLCLNYIKLVDEGHILVVDEIGKMEMLSKNFEESINDLLTTNRNLKVIATVPLKSTSGLIDKLKQHPRSRLFHITKSNRDEIYPEILQATKKL